MTLRIYLMLSLAALIVSCASKQTQQATILPHESGDYTVITNSKSEQTALNDAVDQGNKYCQAKGKEFVVADSSVLPKDMNQGAEQAAEMAGKILGQVLPQNTKARVAKNTVYTRDGDQLMMNFKCK